MGVTVTTKARQNRIKIATVALFALVLCTLTATRFKTVSTHEFADNQWVDSVFLSLNLDQKIGQCFMIATRSDRNEAYYQQTENLILKHHVGGLIFFQGTPYRQAALTNRYQRATKVPLLIGIDGEWGLAMRLDSAIGFPRQMTLGAITNDSLLYQMGDQIGQQCNRLGIHVNFAPVADINSNPRNPVIGMRSFGEDRENVTQKSLAYMGGLQHNKIITTAKHFPGHGDTDLDSHHTLPVVSHSANQLNDTDLYPFRRLIAGGVTGIVTGHLQVPALENTPHLAASLSEKIVTQLLQNEMGFRGLIFTDAMNMRGVSQGRTPADANLKALLAGNDILLYPESVAASVLTIKAAICKGTFTEEMLNGKVKKILRAKYWAGLHKTQNIDLENVGTKINSTVALKLKDLLCQNAVTLLANQDHLLPLTLQTDDTLASVCIGLGYNNTFQNTLNKYGRFKHVALYEKPSSDEMVDQILAQVSGAKTIILSFHDTRKSLSHPYVFPPATLRLVSQLQQQSKVIFCFFAIPYPLQFLPETSAVVSAYEDSPAMNQAVCKLLFGEILSKGKLPVSVDSKYKMGFGL